MIADIIIKASSLFTAKDAKVTSGSICIAGDKIVAIVPLGEENNFVGASTKIIEAKEGLVIPGLIDAHTHFFNGALANSEHVCNDIEKSTSEEDCARIIAEYAKAHPDEKRIRGRGWFITNWGTTELPTKASLDAVIPDKPVYLGAADCHSYWLNSAALEECGITKDTEVSSGYIGKLPNGELSGMLVEMEACIYAEKKYREFSYEDQMSIYQNFMEKAAAYGVTSLSEMIPGEYDDEHFIKYSIVKKIADEGKAKTRLHLFTKLYDVDDFNIALDWKDKLDGPFLKLAGVKGFIDGVAETYTGLLLEPYTDRPDTCGIGVPAKPLDELKDVVYRANEAGLPVRIHCIADGSVRMALDAFEYANSKCSKKGLANTIEHVENIHPDDIARFKELNVIPSMQPIHIILDADGKITRIGEERIKYEWPLKSLVDSFGLVALGTDYPVVDLNPFDNIYSAVTRCNFDGSSATHNDWEKLSVGEALMGYTTWAAKAYSREDEIGQIAEGMLADVVILDTNLFEVSPSKILDTKVLTTIVNGKIVYEAK